ncbi:hypothetical protein [Canibacter zhoujuaniae]|uniref:hypothetical protein n=1 Tax=Canibacter zhoujuaniae TaxID=2708343 RepID=UPI001421EBE2|nr:hypothetical protein [Canibacter zhoujuaniae]
MTVLNVIGETFFDHDHEANRFALQDLTAALLATAPRGCKIEYLLPRGSQLPQISDPNLTISEIPLAAKTLPVVWRASAAANPLSGEFVHALTPLAPTSPLSNADGTQVTVSVTHLPEASVGSPLNPVTRAPRALLKRAIKNANRILATSHTLAEKLQAQHGATRVNVVPLAAPTEFLPGDNAKKRRQELSLPKHYIVTTAAAGSAELESLVKAVTAVRGAPQLVVLDTSFNFLSDQSATADSATPAAADNRVCYPALEAATDIGAVLAGAELLVLPQQHLEAGYEVYAALEAGIPIAHAEHDEVTEFAQEGSVVFSNQETLERLLQDLFDSDSQASAQLQTLQVLAADRSGVYSWDRVAREIWQIHAEI